MTTCSAAPQALHPLSLARRCPARTTRRRSGRATSARLRSPCGPTALRGRSTWRARSTRRRWPLPSGRPQRRRPARRAAWYSRRKARNEITAEQTCAVLEEGGQGGQGHSRRLPQVRRALPLPLPLPLPHHHPRPHPRPLPLPHHHPRPHPRPRPPTSSSPQTPLPSGRVRDVGGGALIHMCAAAVMYLGQQCGWERLVAMVCWRRRRVDWGWQLQLHCHFRAASTRRSHIRTDSIWLGDLGRPVDMGYRGGYMGGMGLLRLRPSRHQGRVPDTRIIIQMRQRGG